METINIHGAPNIIPAFVSGWEIDNTKEGVCACVCVCVCVRAHGPRTMKQRVAGLMGDGGQGRLHGEGDGAKWAKQVSREGAFRPEGATSTTPAGAHLVLAEGGGGQVGGNRGSGRARHGR